MSLEADYNESLLDQGAEAANDGQHRIKRDAPEIPGVLRCLFEEHRHLTALMHALERRVRQAGSLKVGDYYLLRDIVGYMHDYPDQIHHPTENRLFELLLQRQPSRRKAVNRLRSDHEAVAKETQDLLDLLDEAIDEQTAERERAVRKACEAFVSHQRAHMQFENREMFPAAIDSLLPADWKQIESHFAAVDDPLFGQVVGNRHRLLYEYLMSPAARVSEKFTGSRLFSLESLIMTVDALEEGTVSWCSRVKDLGEDVSEETRAVVAKSLRPESLGSAIVLPINYAAFLGKSLFDCSGDLLRIYSTTVKKGIRAFF